MQADTIHYVSPLSKQRRHVYTLIDLYSRMAYVEAHHHIWPGMAATAIAHAQEAFGFRLGMVQADNAPEFGRYFT
jgi:hypothetical protein